MKKITVIILVVAMLFSLVGCQGNVEIYEVAQAEVVETEVVVELSDEEAEEVDEVEETEEDGEDSYVSTSYSGESLVKILASSAAVYADDEDEDTSTNETLVSDTEDEDTAATVSSISISSANEEEITVYSLFDGEDEILSWIISDDGINFTIIDFEYEIANLIDESLFDIIYLLLADVDSYYIQDVEVADEAEEVDSVIITETIIDDIVAFLNQMLTAEYTSEDIILPEDSDAETLTLQVLDGVQKQIVLVKTQDNEEGDGTVEVEYSYIITIGEIAVEIADDGTNDELTFVSSDFLAM